MSTPTDRNGAPRGEGEAELTERQRADLRRAEREAQKAEKRRAREARPRLKKLRFLAVLSGLFALAVVSWVFGVIMAVAQDLPDLEAAAQFARAENSEVYASEVNDVGDSEPIRLATLTGNEQRILLESEEISPLMKQAVIAIEDERFYEHRGIDYIALARALREDILAGSAVQGGSTITQQFVKNALDAQQDRSILQKLKESALAYQIEQRWSKDKILTNYLNNIYFGEGAYGIEAAAKTFFGANHPGCGEDTPEAKAEDNRCASQLRVEEAAMLAGMISSPTAYSPKANPEAAEERRNVVLSKMSELGFITAEQFADLREISAPAPSKVEPPTEESLAPYFTDWLRQQVVDRYGAGVAFGGGLEITSTIDLSLQEQAQQIVSDRLSGLGPTAAVVVIENATGAVRAIVGGSDFETSPFNLATNGRRQPGSAFKPFTLITALENGASPTDVYESRPIELPFVNRVRKKNGEIKEINELFKVNNYEDNYLGSATIGSATTYSDNSVYAQMGMIATSPDKISETAEEMGIGSNVPSNPAMILGGLKRGVTPLEMAYAYSTIANGGRLVSGTMASRGNGEGPVAIESVTRNDKPLKDSLGASGENEKTVDQVIDEGVAEQTKTLLRSVVTQGTGTRAQIGDDFIWGKTGTTDNNADAWFVGANEEVTVAVWVGYADGAIPMETEFGGAPVDGGTIPTLIFRDVVLAYAAINGDRGAARDQLKALKKAEKAAEATDGVITPSEETAPEEGVEEAPAPSDSGGDAGAPSGGGGEGSSGGDAAAPAPAPVEGGGVGIG